MTHEARLLLIRSRAEYLRRLDSLEEPVDEVLEEHEHTGDVEVQTGKPDRWLRDYMKKKP